MKTLSTDARSKLRIYSLSKLSETKRTLSPFRKWLIRLWAVLGVRALGLQPVHFGSYGCHPGWEGWERQTIWHEGRLVRVRRNFWDCIPPKL